VVAEGWPCTFSAVVFIRPAQAASAARSRTARHSPRDAVCSTGRRACANPRTSRLLRDGIGLVRWYFLIRVDSHNHIGQLLAVFARLREDRHLVGHAVQGSSDRP
jgi:hypothetical protein